MADEFATIAGLFRPLASGAPEALNLTDDVAVLTPRPGEDLVVTADAIVEGVHFLPEDPLDLVARKLLRVNLSDLAAKGAEPFAYLLTVAWPARCGWEARRAFAAGLAADQAEFGVRLIGGDTVSTPGPLTASVTAFGRVPSGAAVLRSGARAGDRLFVSGTIGDGGLGLKACRGELDMPEADLAWLRDRYRLPRPRTALREALRLHGRASADVSDGLIADAGHLAGASGLALAIDLERLPLSPAARAWSAGRLRSEALGWLATCGDDYEVVCAVALGEAEAFTRLAREAGVPVADIGAFAEGEGVVARLDGEPLEILRPGWSHP